MSTSTQILLMTPGCYICPRIQYLMRLTRLLVIILISPPINRQMNRTIVNIICISVFSAIGVVAQTNPKTPVEHMEYLSNFEKVLSQKYLTYMSEVAHGQKARRME